VGLVCVGFTVLRGYLTKYGLFHLFDLFLHDGIDWQVDLNYVDPADGWTV
jgi:hypothetical protein